MSSNREWVWKPARAGEERVASAGRAHSTRPELTPRPGGVDNDLLTQASPFSARSGEWRYHARAGGSPRGCEPVCRIGCARIVAGMGKQRGRRSDREHSVQPMQMQE